jgi:hypothetical protein
MKPILLHIVLCAAMILCISNAVLGQSGSATITKTVEGLHMITVELGDKLSVKLQVNNPYSNPVLVNDDLGSALKYIAGTCMLDGAYLTPTLNDNIISFSMEQGSHEITYEFQVVQVEASNTYINNVAQVHDPDCNVDNEDSLQITLSPYGGFFKWLSCESYSEYPDDLPALPLGEDIVFVMEVNIRNYFDFTMQSVEVRDDLPAEFEVDDYWCETGDLTVTTKNGKAKKVCWTWSIGDLAPTAPPPDDGISSKIWLSTALNPAGKQHFISPGEYDIAKAVVIKFTDPSTGYELRANTGSVSVYAGNP